MLILEDKTGRNEKNIYEEIPIAKHFIIKGKVKQFYMLYIVLSIVLGYILGSFLLEFMTIHL